MQVPVSHIIAIVFILLSGECAFAQEAPVFAYLFNQEGKVALKPAAAYKYDVALKVFNDLLRARGDMRQQAPELVMNDGERYVAWMDPANARVGIEERAYDVCAGFGPDSLRALAALLSHELTHYYEKHDWSRNFVHYNESLEAARQIHALDEGIKQETQADCLGGFLAFSAGYNVYNLMPKLLEKLYAAYGLPEQLPGYPGLQERIQLTNNASIQLRELQTVYEIAQYLSILENYEDAAYYYRHILQSFQSREVYNNVGVNLALAALSHFSMTEMPYVLPLEPDPDSRLYNLKGMQFDRLKLRQTLLDQALGQFDRSLALDPGYATAYLNKACVLALTGAWDDASYWLKKGKRLKAANDASDFNVLEGILAAMQKDSVEAQAIFLEAKTSGSLLAAINLNVLLQAPREAANAPVAVSMEKIDGMRIDEFMRSPQVEKEIALGKKMICGVKQLPHSKIMLHYANDGQQYVVVQWCGDGCNDPTQSRIRNGTDIAELTEAYGPAQRVIAHPDGMVWVYPGRGLLFLIHRNGKVKEWGVFRKTQ